MITLHPIPTWSASGIFHSTIQTHGMSCSVAGFTVPWQIFYWRLGHLLRLGSSLSKSDWLGCPLILLPYTSVTATVSFFDTFFNTVFLFAMAVSALRCKYVTIGAINELDVRSFFESHQRLHSYGVVSRCERAGFREWLLYPIHPT